MKLERITAEWARNTANSVLSEKVQNQILQCEDSIKAAVKKNEMSCNMFFTLESLTKKELIKRGFEVEFQKGYDQRDSDYTIIKW